MSFGRGVVTSLVVAVGMAAAGSYLHAQPAPSFVTTTEPASEPLRALTPEQMQAEAAAMVARMNVQLQHGLHVQATARDAKDVLKLTCVNQKLVEARALVNLGDNGLAALTKAIKAGTQADQRAHFQQVAQASAECDQAANDLDGCLGADDVNATQNTNDVKRPVMLDDPTDDCNNLGRTNCLTQPLEYVAWASPFTPN